MSDIIERAEHWVSDVPESRYAKTLVIELVAALKAVRSENERLSQVPLYNAVDRLSNQLDAWLRAHPLYEPACR
jgi:hypothetical protein